MHKLVIKALILSTMFTFCLTTCSSAADKGAKKEAQMKPGLYAVFHTTMGTITCSLFEKEAPKTVENFVGLAEGTREWTDPKTNTKQKKRFYDGLIFHRVIPNFMIQGGDPEGTGRGGPGYQFEDEFNAGLKFDTAGKAGHGQCRPQHQRKPVLYNHRSHAMAG